MIEFIVEEWISSLINEYGVEDLSELPIDNINKEIEEAVGTLKNCEIFGDSLGMNCNNLYIRTLRGVINEKSGSNY